jgi:hypothetical protein
MVWRPLLSRNVEDWSTHPRDGHDEPPHFRQLSTYLLIGWICVAPFFFSRGPSTYRAIRLSGARYCVATVLLCGVGIAVRYIAF